MGLEVCLGGFEGYSYEQGSCKVQQLTKVFFFEELKTCKVVPLIKSCTFSQTPNQKFNLEIFLQH